MPPANSPLPKKSNSQNRPTSDALAPDPARTYERAQPEHESGMGELDSPVGDATPTDRADAVDDSVGHRQPGDRQLNGQDDSKKREGIEG